MDALSGHRVAGSRADAIGLSERHIPGSQDNSDSALEEAPMQLKREVGNTTRKQEQASSEVGSTERHGTVVSLCEIVSAFV
jgi:hypothetical protein